MKIKYILLSIIFLWWWPCYSQEPGVIVVPVADLLGTHEWAQFPHGKDLFYHHLPLSPWYKDYEVCPRIFQALFNEQITILKEDNKQILIRISTAFYDTPVTQNVTDFWTLKKNVLSIKQLKEWHLDVSKLPSAINWQHPETLDTGSIISLIGPWDDTLTKQTYSAGTRFVLAYTPRHEEPYQVYILHPKARKIVVRSIPRALAFITEIRSPHTQRQQFLKILKTWADPKNGIIPYVWGGCSVTHRYHKKTLLPQKTTISGKSLSYYDRIDIPYHPKTGFDCARLILRAAQLAGIPFFYENTLAIAQHLRPCAPDEEIEAGDIIWIPGHVMIVSNLSKNMLIEARSYDHGYGYVQEIPLSEEFKDIVTYQQLCSAYEQKKGLNRIDIKGNIRQVIHDFKILKLAAIWK